MEMNNKKLTFLKYFSCALIVIVFAIVLFINYARYNAVYAADYAAGEVCTGFSFSGATSYENAVLKVSATGESGICSDSAGNATLTVKNTLSDPGTITFNYTVSVNGGSIKIDGSNVTSNGSFSKEVAAGASFKIEITTKKGANTTFIDLNTIKGSFAINANITFQAADLGGKYTVQYDGNTHEITSTVTEPISAENEITFKAIPETGYKLYYWIINDSKVNGAIDTFSASYTKNTSIKPVFCDENAAIFTTKAGGEYFTSLTAANNYAKTAADDAKVIVPVEKNTMILAGNYEISSGVTLLIPFDSMNTLYKATPVVVYGSHSTPSAFKTLTLSSNAVITVKNDACISVSSKLSASGTGAGSWNGTPTGAGGRIMMSETSKIILESGSNLYCWGYISGTKNSSNGLCSGQIIAQSGSIVYEAFQIRSWRGGTATSNMAGSNKSKKVFPIPTYYVQNIECELKLFYGAREELYTSVNASSSAFPTSASFIGTSSGIFRFTSSSSSSDYIIKRYNYKNDQLEVVAHANINLSNITVSVSVATVNSSDFVLPINDVAIRVISGYTISLAQDIAFIPDSKLIIDEGGVLDVTGGKNIYVYDIDNWGNYATNGANIVPVGYSVANETTTKRTAATLKDAEIIINGLLQVSGGLYTTSGGANIHSEITYNSSNPNNGVIKFDKAPGTETTTYQVVYVNSAISYEQVPITSAKLKNGTAYAGTDGEFFETSTAYEGARFVFQTQYNENYDPLPFEYNKWGIYNDIIFHTITYTDGTNHYNTQFRESGSYTFEYYPNPDDPNASIYTLNNDYRIKGWIVEYNYVEYFYGLGEINNNMSFTSDITATAFYGGYVNDGDEVYYIDKGSETYESGLVKGLYRARTQDGTSIEIMYFDLEDGHLIKNPSENIVTFSGYYNNATYYIDNNGYVKNLNLLRKVVINGAEDFDISYYYFDEYNQALKSGTYYINTSNSSLNMNCENLSVVLPSGYYTFDSEGRIIGVNGTGVFKSPTLDSYVEFDGTNFTIDGIKVAVGLVEMSGDVYYIQDDFTVATSKTVYVTKFYNTQSTYGIGLYYFGEDGKMISYKEVA